MEFTRRNFLQITGMAALPVPHWASNLFQTPNGTFKEIRRNVGVFENPKRGGTIGWLINKEGIVVVDSQFPDSAKECIDKIQGVSDQNIELLINTHHHGDHTGGNIAFQGLAKKVLAHKNSKANQERVAKERDREAGQLYPNAVFDTKWSEPIGNEQVTLWYFGPAHTDGDALIHFEKANVVHMGDLVFNRRFPFIDKSSGASIENWIQVLAKARKTFNKKTIFIFGHSANGFPLTGTIEDLKAKESFLENLLTHVTKAKNAGQSIEELLANTTSIPGSDEWQGRGIERGLKAAWTEINK